ncbi:MAG: alpha-N-arabinofuranosidase, partial [Oscillospiraceae bacterium]|nr:alpha-N-arabinofuranosidase [Oscillospiraceae bacterium]
IRDFGGEFSGTDRAWAPQALWDDEAQSYMVYWASSTSKNDVAAMYFAHTTDFKNITFPTLMYAREGIQTIDGDIVFNEQNGKYYMYFKHDEDQTIAFVTADRPTGPYTDQPTVVSLADSGVEGSEIYRITGTDTWIMMMDEYGAGRFIAQQTKDMEHFSRLPDSAYSYGPTPRHGSVLAISDKEYDALVTAFGT